MDAPTEFGARVLRVAEEGLNALRIHCEESYPHEVWGAILGQDGGGQRVALQVHPLTDTVPNACNSIVEKEHLIAVEKEAMQKGMKVLGYYHSHVNRSANPTKADFEKSAPWYSYVIISVVDGKAHDLTSWELKEDRSCFYSEKIGIVASTAR